ncbi:MAG TPA: DUF937 domain-containing protein, partial [Roseiflexaceae bacterium]|nr:DUF937 domain-containing protein [Roseiflexaceae bacterium]
MSPVTESVIRQLGPDAIDAMSQRLGVDPQVARQGVEVGIPLLLSALARNASTDDGAQSLSNALSQDHDGSALSHIPEVIGQYQSNDASGIVRHALGDQRGAVEQQLSQQLGLDGGALLQMLAPLVLAQLGKTQRQQGLNPSEVAGTLRNEEQYLQAGGMLDIVGQILGSAGINLPGLGGAPQTGPQTPTTPATPGIPGLPGTPTTPGVPTLPGSIPGGPLAQMLFSVFGPGLIRNLAKRFGVSEATVQQALIIAIPLLLSALARNTSSEKGAESLFGALTRDHDGSVLGDVDQVLADPASRQGDRIVTKVLGSQSQSIEQTITEQTGIDGGQLLSTLAPIVMGVLGSQARRQGMDAQSLASTLQQEETTLQHHNSDVMQAVREALGPQESQAQGGLAGLLGRL